MTPIIEEVVERKVREVIHVVQPRQTDKNKLPKSTKGSNSISKHISEPTIAINVFGYENYDHLLRPYLVRALHETNDMTLLLQRIIVDLFFNPKVKVNHNVFIPLDSFKSINVFTKNGWVTKSLHGIIDKIVLRANDVLQHYFVACNLDDQCIFQDEIGKRKYDILVDFTNKVDKMEKYPDFYGKLQRDTEHTIITSQHLVHTNLCRDLVLSRLGTL